MQTICLNMIVKNEAHVIKKTLETLCKYINFDYWVISDTGSSDGTQDIIVDFFKQKNIKGELHDDNWKDFGYNRTLALEYAYNKSDYLLIFDADDDIHGDLKLPTLNCDGYDLLFCSGGIKYKRTLLINNRKKWKFVGVLHEYITCSEHATMSTIEGNYHLISGRNGDRSKDPNKYLKDAQILEKAYYEAIENDDQIAKRYSFYCANSYKDCGEFAKAIEWYKTCIKIANWNQEQYVSCERIYECYEKLNQKENGFYYLVDSVRYDSQRLECLYHLIVHYCIQNMDLIAFNYYLNIKNFYENEYANANFSLSDKLFVDVSKYDFFLPYYMIIVTERLKKHDIGIKMYEIIFDKKNSMFNEWWIENLFHNLSFFIEKVPKSEKTAFLNKLNDYADFLLQNGVNREKIFSNWTKLKDDETQKEQQQENSILFYTGYSNAKWNFSFAKNNAMGGSESAVLSLANELSTSCKVYISGGVKEETHGNMIFVEFDKLEELIRSKKFKAIIVSRYLHFFEFYPYAKAEKIYLMAHDVCFLNYGSQNLSDVQLLEKWDDKIDGCVCLTEWHKNIFIDKYPTLKNKISTINNGINLALFPKNQKKILNRFVYTSCSERGLINLLNTWEKILSNIPDAELYISSYNEFPKNEDEKRMETMIKSNPSIKHVGKLSKAELYNLMSSAEYWFYPCIFPETSCITAMEMLMSEVICLYYPYAGLNNTIGEYGIQVNENNVIEKILNLTTCEKNNLKKNGKKYSESCSWENRAKNWSELLCINQEKEQCVINIFNNSAIKIYYGKDINNKKNVTFTAIKKCAIREINKIIIPVGNNLRNKIFDDNGDENYVFVDIDGNVESYCAEKQVMVILYGENKKNQESLLIDKIYLINMKNATNRKQHFLDEIERESIEKSKIEFFEAIDGQTHNYTEKELRMFKNANFIDKEHLCGCVGNQLSHYYVMKDMIQKKYEKIIVFQDDVMLRCNFVKYCNDILNNCNDVKYEVIWIGLHKEAYLSHFVPLNINGNYDKTYIDYKINEYMCKLNDTTNPCSLAYIITLEGAKNYVEYLENNNIYQATDRNFNDYLIKKNMFFGSNDMLCTGNNKFESKIFSKKNTNFHEILRNKILSLK